MLFMLAFMLALLHVMISADQSIFSMETNPEIAFQLQYLDSVLPVWQHATKEDTLFVQPLVYLNPLSARVLNNTIMETVEMLFEVLMWNPSLLCMVDKFAPCSGHCKVSTVLTEKVRILWAVTGQTFPGVKLVNTWQPNTHLPRMLTFRFICETWTACTTLAEAMHTKPEIFDPLTLQYTVDGRGMSRRMIDVKTEHVMSGRLLSELDNRFKGKEEAYLSSDDLNTVASEGAQLVESSVIQDSDFIETGDEMTVAKVISGALATQSKESQEFSEDMWKSVFWQDEMARPDKIASELNKVFYKNASDDKHVYIKDSERHRLVDFGFKYEAGIAGIASAGGSLNVKTQNVDKDKISKDEMNKMLAESQKNVEWKGEKIKVKPMKLHRLNLSQLRKSTKLTSVRVKMTKHNTSPTIQVDTKAVKKFIDFEVETWKVQQCPTPTDIPYPDIDWVNPV